AAIANPITIAIAAVTALVAGFMLLYNNSDILREKLSAVWESIKAGFSGLGERVKEIWSGMWNAILEQLEPFIEIWSEFWSTITEPFIEIWNEFKTELTEVFSELINDIITLGENVKRIFSEMWNFLADYLGPRIELMKELIHSFVTNVRDWFIGLGEKVVEVFKNLWAR